MRSVTQSALHTYPVFWTSHSVGVAVPVQLQMTEFCVVPEDRIPAAVPHLLVNPYDNEDRMYLTSVRWSWLEYELNGTTFGRAVTASSIFMSWEWPGISLVICRRVGGSPSTAVTGRWFYFEFLQDTYLTVLYLWHDRCASRIRCGVYLSQRMNINFTITTEIFRRDTNWTSGVWNSVETRNFLSFTPVQTGTEANTASNTMGIGSLFRW